MDRDKNLPTVVVDTALHAAVLVDNQPAMRFGAITSTSDWWYFKGRQNKKVKHSELASTSANIARNSGTPILLPKEADVGGKYAAIVPLGNQN